MCKLKVTVEIEFEIIDPVELERAALATVDATEFTGGEAEHGEEREHVRASPAGAVE